MVGLPLQNECGGMSRVGFPGAVGMVWRTGRG